MKSILIFPQSSMIRALTNCCDSAPEKARCTESVITRAALTLDCRTNTWSQHKEPSDHRPSKLLRLRVSFAQLFSFIAGGNHKHIHAAMRHDEMWPVVNLRKTQRLDHASRPCPIPPKTPACSANYHCTGQSMSFKMVGLLDGVLRDE